MAQTFWYKAQKQDLLSYLPHLGSNLTIQDVKVITTIWKEAL